MKKWNLLDQATTPDGQTLGLYQHDGTYSIRVGALELMSTRRHASEERMAELACAKVSDRRKPRLLVGGLGFGFTARAALAHLPPEAALVIAELMPAVVAWNRNPAYGLGADVLSDKRVRLVEGDVGALIARERLGFDAILLDVDNGPAALSSEGNEKLYQEVGLHRTKAALRPGGWAVFWSAASSPLFAKRLSSVGFQRVEVERARAHATSGGWHTLFMAQS